MAEIRINESVCDILEDVVGMRPHRIMEASYGFTWIDIAIQDPTRMSGIPVNKDFRCLPSNSERRDFGVFLKPGKLLRAIFPDREDIPSLAAQLQSYMTGRDEEAMGSLLMSRNPSEIYTIDHCRGGSIGSSCMRSQDTTMFELYDEMYNTGILYMLNDNGGLVARALIHDKVKVNSYPYDETIKLMDRIYVNNDNLFQLFYNWASRNGYYRKAEQNYTNRTGVLSPTGAHSHKELTIDIPRSEFELIPFLDTFTFYCSCDQRILNTGNSCYEDVLDHVDGTTHSGVLSEGGAQYDSHCEDCSCGIDTDYDEYIYIENHGYICGNCRDRNYRYCDRCEEFHEDGYMQSVMIRGERWEQSVCDTCLESFYYCDQCEMYSEEGLVEVRLKSYGFVTEICETCNDGEEYENCDSCYTSHSGDDDEEDDCPTCRKIWRERGAVKQGCRALNRRIAASPLSIANMPGAFIYKDTACRLRVSRKFSLQGVEMLVIRDRYSAIHFQSMPVETWELYDGFKDLPILVDMILTIIAEVREGLKPKKYILPVLDPAVVAGIILPENRLSPPALSEPTEELSEIDLLSLFPWEDAA